MKKKYLLIILLTVLCLFGCKKNKDDEEPEVKLPEDTIAFLEAVDKFDFSKGSKEDLDSVFVLYENLGENSWNYDEVLNSFNLLVAYENLLKEKEDANHFISLVEDIPYNVTLNDKVKIDAALLAYNDLSDSAKGFTGVEIAYNTLKSAKDTYTTLEDAQNAIIDEVAISEFIRLTKQIPALNIFIYEDIIYVEEAENFYLTLSDTAKQKEEVIAANEIVTAARAHYDSMQDDPSIYDQVIIDRFIEKVKLLPKVEDVTLNDKSLIEDAENAYFDLSVEAKEAEDVINSYQTLISVKEKYNELLAEKEEQERLEALEKQKSDFLTLVNGLPAVDNLTKADGPNIADARYSYDNLPKLLKEEENIKVALEKIVALEEKFDTFTLEKITFSFYNLITSGGTTPNVVLQGIELTFYSTIKKLYNVTTGEQLGKCVDFYFYIYHAAETNPDNYICYGDIENVLISQGNVVSYGTIINLLQEASKTDPDLKSGNFKFGVRVIDRRNMYADSDIFIGTGVINYTFNSLYDDGTSDPIEVIQISTKEEFLAIKDNLAGHYVLTADIDLEGMEWENLGKFSGTLDGQGHKIKNIAHSTGGDAVFGIFLEVLGGAKVSRIVLEGTVTNAGYWAGAICIKNFGTIENCIINLDITATGEAGYIGGISTDNYGTIRNCLVLSKINGEGTLWGSCTSNLVINNFGNISNSFASKDNSLTDKAIHANNGSSINSGCYTNNELKNSSLYSSWDPTIWNITYGELPSLIIE